MSLLLVSELSAAKLHAAGPTGYENTLSRLGVQTTDFPGSASNDVFEEASIASKWGPAHLSRFRAVRKEAQKRIMRMSDELSGPIGKDPSCKEGHLALRGEWT